MTEHSIYLQHIALVKIPLDLLVYYWERCSIYSNNSNWLKKYATKEELVVRRKSDPTEYWLTEYLENNIDYQFIYSYLLSSFLLWFVKLLKLFTTPASSGTEYSPLKRNCLVRSK